MPNPAIQVMLGGDYCVDGETTPRAALWGPAVRSAASRTMGPAEVFLVILTAMGAARIARSGLSPMMNQAVALDDLDGRAWSGLPEALAEAHDFERRIELAEGSLRGALSIAAPAASRTLAMADAILGHRLTGTVASLAAAAGFTERRLHSDFAREIGCSPKRLLRVARLQRVLRVLHPRPWSFDATQDPVLEYFDLAHLDRDFRDLTGMSRVSYVSAKITRGDRLVHTVI